MITPTALAGVAFVIETNIVRRHLKPYQIAHAVAKSKELIAEEVAKAKTRQLGGLKQFQDSTVPEALQERYINKQNQPLNLKRGHKGEALDQVANHFGGQVSTRSLYQAIKIQGTGWQSPTGFSVIVRLIHERFF